MLPAVTNSVMTPDGAAINVLWTPDVVPAIMSFIEPGTEVVTQILVWVGGATAGNGVSVAISMIAPFTNENCPVNAANGLKIATNSNLPALRNEVIQFASLIISPSATFSMVFASVLTV